VVCGECGKPARVGRRFLEDGRKVRACRRCNGILDK
jgi:large subunit ribosomal protein L24